MNQHGYGSGVPTPPALPPHQHQQMQRLKKIDPHIARTWLAVVRSALVTLILLAVLVAVIGVGIEIVSTISAFADGLGIGGGSSGYDSYS